MKEKVTNIFTGHLLPFMFQSGYYSHYASQSASTTLDTYNRQAKLFGQRLAFLDKHKIKIPSAKYMKKKSS